MDLIWIPMWIFRESLHESHMDFAWVLAWIPYGSYMAPCMDPTWIRTWILYGSYGMNHMIWSRCYGSYGIDHIVWVTWYASYDMDHMLWIRMGPIWIPAWDPTWNPVRISLHGTLHGSYMDPCLQHPNLEHTMRDDHNAVHQIMFFRDDRALVTTTLHSEMTAKGARLTQAAGCRNMPAEGDQTQHAEKQR